MPRFAPLTLLLLLPLLAAGCAATQRQQGQAERQALLQRLPAEINGFTLQPPPPDAVTDHSARQLYRQGEAGVLIGVMLTGIDPGVPEGADSPPARVLRAAIATQIFAQAGSLPGAQAERGPDFNISRRGETPPLAGCADLRLHHQARMLRDLSCTAVIERQVLLVKLLTVHGPDQVDAVRQMMGDFSGRVVEAMRQLPPPENDAGAPPAGAGKPQAEPPRRLQRT
ncbi:hypothetical protein [Pseudoroseomonas cervicalis]|uniref:hypothetical protein n=1 Tax=Teichococcus cervicalis TaxID=204525 RepID=UPI00277D2102|nr:hypothetical protein [Pseudoroseomonas cervicalis]MDQ1078725.1 hypothetical protein [Pseudoroseomonas cervicalis]